MEKNGKVKKSIALSALATGTVVLGSMAGSVQAADLFSFETLGSGAELRSELLSANDATGFIKNSELELKCGEGKADGKKDGKATGEKAKAADAKAEKSDKAGEHKCGEGKCGEGKCGEKKEEKKEEKKAEDSSNDSPDK